MKLSEVIPFLTFSAISDHAKIEEQFNNCHSNHQSKFPYWSIQATRRKLMSNFWYATVFRHFISLYCIALLVIAFFNYRDWFNPTIFMVSVSLFCFAFFVMLFFIYLPAYQSMYLPLLDSYLESYSGKQLEALQKCKKQQYSVVALMLIHHVYQKMAGLQPVLINTGNAQLLARQYGISIKSICPALQLIQRGEWDRDSIRKRTETLDDFETAKEHFRLLQNDKAVLILEHLQQKILQRGAVV